MFSLWVDNISSGEAVETMLPYSDMVKESHYSDMVKDWRSSWSSSYTRSP